MAMCSVGRILDKSTWTGTPLQARLYERLKGQPYPLFVFDQEQTFPAAALWTGARAWVRAFRDAGVQPGDRLVLTLPASIAFVQVLVAALWEGVTLAIAAPESAPDRLMEHLDAAWAVAPQGSALQGIWTPEGCSGPDPTRRVLRRVARLAPTPATRFLLATSGTTGQGKWVALGEEAVLHCVESHLGVLDYQEAQTHVLSVLPWHHVFGLVLDLLPALLAGCELTRDPKQGRDPQALLRGAQALGATHLNTVPLLLKRVQALPGGKAFLQSLEGGIVGGAPVDAELAAFLTTTRLRVGYGQTEAAPGISLGEPGEWPEAGYLGRPLGCETQVLATGELRFRGLNLFQSYWSPEQGVVPVSRTDWWHTGDLVRQTDSGQLFFRGRTDDCFKLANGRRVIAGEWERRLKEHFAPALDEALLFSTDGESLALALLWHPDTARPEREALQSLLGPLGARLERVEFPASESWVWQAKGTLNRRATLERLREVPLLLGSDRPLTCAEIVREAHKTHPRASLTVEARAAMERSMGYRSVLEALGEPIYGTTTGFGPFVRFASGEAGGYTHGAGLIAHLGAGYGDDAPACVVRATLLIRAQNLAQGYSGIRPEVLDAYLGLLSEGVVPSVPTIGSVGASGDLVPLGHIARVLSERLPLSGREALALTNGTSFLTAYAAHAVVRAERLLAHAECLTGWLYRALGCRLSALDPRLHAARGHLGQQVSAERIAQEASRADRNDEAARPLQEVYSLRCAPQVLGACRENLEHARRLVEAELNGVSDNPLFFEGPAVAHGGNFHGQQVAFAADALNAALVQTGVLVERQLDALITPGVTNGQAPLLLAWEPGPHSGLAGVQLTATALVAELRAHGGPAATLSIPTNGGNQDVVSMGTLAARLAYSQAERLAGVLAALALGLIQYTHLQSHGKAPGAPTPPPVGLPELPGLREDRPLRAELALLSRYFLESEPVAV